MSQLVLEAIRHLVTLIQPVLFIYFFTLCCHVELELSINTTRSFVKVFRGSITVRFIIIPILSHIFLLINSDVLSLFFFFSHSAIQIDSLFFLFFFKAI